MKTKRNKMDTKSWKDIKDTVYGKKGTERRDGLERDFESFKIGLVLRNAREEKNLTQQQLGELVDKKRTYISRVENNGSNLTLKTLYEIVEKGLGGKIICVPVNDPIYSKRMDIADLNPHRLKEIEHFFQVYKDLEEKKVDTGGWGNAEEAIKIYHQCVKRYDDSDHKKKRTFTI